MKNTNIFLSVIEVKSSFIAKFIANASLSNLCRAKDTLEVIYKHVTKIIDTKVNW